MRVSARILSACATRVRACAATCAREIRGRVQRIATYNSRASANGLVRRCGGHEHLITFERATSQPLIIVDVHMHARTHAVRVCVFA